MATTLEQAAALAVAADRRVLGGRAPRQWRKASALAAVAQAEALDRIAIAVEQLVARG
jgi:hypothetical protein